MQEDVILKQLTTYRFSRLLAKFLGKTWVDIYAKTSFGKDDYEYLVNRRVYERFSANKCSSRFVLTSTKIS